MFAYSIKLKLHIQAFPQSAELADAFTIVLKSMQVFESTRGLKKWKSKSPGIKNSIMFIFHAVISHMKTSFL